jgi:RluA family pseudouridine synthase
MEREGFRQIYQLDGGILKYFEECGGAHYDGECFVFDQRVGVDPALRETDTMQCFQCLSPLSESEQADERYEPGKSCPYCFQTRAEQMASRIESREAAIREVSTPLPGSTAYDNFRPLTIPLGQDGRTIKEALSAIFPHSAEEDWTAVFQNKHLLGHNKSPVDPEQIVRSGERYFRRLPSLIEPDVNPDIRLLHEDEAIIVINKPAPLPVHPSGRYNLNTLQSLLQKVYYPQKPRPAHRLDANTTGIVIFSRTRHFAKFLQPQFERGEVEKTYLARVLGNPAETHFFCDVPIGASPVEAGGRTVDPVQGMPSRTEFRVREHLADGTTLLEAMPQTGRTNQIRVHLWHMGMPIFGDPLYQPDQQLSSRQTLSVEDPPLCLHAWKLAFHHPLTHQRIAFETAVPSWAELK